MGRFPLWFDVIKNIINYWYRLENLESTFPLLKDAYITSKHLLQLNKPSWYGSVNLILDFIPDIKDISKTSKSIANFKINMKKTLKSKFLEEWHKEKVKNSDGKLRTYVEYKTNFGKESYLSILSSFEQRRALTKFRISSHHLRIETGRYQGTLLNDRTCNNCTSGDVEDEYHFLFVCTKFSEDREKLYSVIHSNCPNFVNLNIKEKLIWLMNTENKAILIAVGKFISKNCK